jgi:hypothetical protein
MLLRRLLVFSTVAAATASLQAISVVHSETHAKPLAVSAARAGVNLTLVQTRWSGFTARWGAVTLALKSIPATLEPVLVVDGFDVIFVGTDSDLLGTYARLTSHCDDCVLFGTTSNQMFPMCPALAPHRLNAGVIMGSTAALLRLANALILAGKSTRGLARSDDQVLLNSKLCNLSPKFVVDANEELVASVEGTETTDSILTFIGFTANPAHREVASGPQGKWCVGKACPLIVHGNGRADLSSLHKWLGITPTPRRLVDTASLKQGYNSVVMWQLRGADCCLGVIVLVHAAVAATAAGVLLLALEYLQPSMAVKGGIVIAAIIALGHVAIFIVPLTLGFLAVLYRCGLPRQHDPGIL